jgi:hypothetical protein
MKDPPLLSAKQFIKVLDPIGAMDQSSPQITKE